MQKQEMAGQYLVTEINLKPIKKINKNLPDIDEVYPTYEGDFLQIDSKRNKGKMVWDGTRDGSAIYSGLTVSKAFSLLYFSIVNGDSEKALAISIGFFRFYEVKAPTIVSEFYDELAIIVNDVIGPANLPLVLAITAAVNRHDRNIFVLASMVQLACQSKKTLVGLHATLSYIDDEGREMANDNGVALNVGENQINAESAECKDVLIELITEALNKSYFHVFELVAKYASDDCSIPSSAMLYSQNYPWKALKTKKSMYVQKHKKGSATTSDINIWYILREFIDAETHDILIESYYRTKSFYFLQNALLIALYGTRYIEFPFLEYIRTYEQQKPLLKSFLNGEFVIENNIFELRKINQDERYLQPLLKKVFDKDTDVTHESANTLISTDKSSLLEIPNVTEDLYDMFDALELEVNPSIVVYGKPANQNRNVAFFSDASKGYRYSGTFMNANPLTEPLIAYLKRVNSYRNTTYNSMLINKYKNGSDYVGSHADDESHLKPNESIASISYGASRIFRTRSKTDKDIVVGNNKPEKFEKNKKVLDVYTKTGTMLVMEGDFQKEFQHEIPKQTTITEPRISVTLRNHSS